MTSAGRSGPTTAQLWARLADGSRAVTRNATPPPPRLGSDRPIYPGATKSCRPRDFFGPGVIGLNSGCVAGVTRLMLAKHGSSPLAIRPHGNPPDTVIVLAAFVSRRARSASVSRRVACLREWTGRRAGPQPSRAPYEVRAQLIPALAGIICVCVCVCVCVADQDGRSR